MSRLVRFHTDAQRELREAALAYEEAREGLGIDFRNAVSGRIEELEEKPSIAKRVPGAPDDLMVSRVLLRRFPYAIVFIERDGMMLVIAVAHQRREPGYWAGRLSS